MKLHRLIIAITAVLLANASSAAPRIQQDVRYAERSARNVLDIYVPADVNQPPLVVWIHGGAFKMGDKADPEGLQAFLQAGMAVASINYRLSDEAIWPAQLEDLRAAFGFLREHAADYGYDGSRIASFGASAGGHLSAMAGIVLAEDPKTSLVASVAWFPPVDFTTMDADISMTGIERKSAPNSDSNSPESLLIGASVKERPDLAKAAGPLHHLDKLPAGARLPAFLIMHGAKDPLIGRGQSGRLFTALLARQEIRTLEYVLLPDGGHGWGDFQKPEAIHRVVDFLKANFSRTSDGAAPQGRFVTPIR